MYTSSVVYFTPKFGQQNTQIMSHFEVYENFAQVYSKLRLDYEKNNSQWLIPTSSIWFADVVKPERLHRNLKGLKLTDELKECLSSH